MANPYIPNKDSEFNTWANNFSTVLTASPATYGLASTDATTVAAVVTAWNAAYALATGGSTRGPSSIAAKNAARVNAQTVIRPYATQIAANQGVTNPNKVNIGVTVRKVLPTPIPTPTTYPIITVIAGTPGEHTMRFADQNSPALRAKPFGAIGCQIFGKASATPITDPTQLPYIQTSTKNPVGVPVPSGSKGMVIYYTAVWITRTGLIGPYAAIINSIGT